MRMCAQSTQCREPPANRFGARAQPFVWQSLPGRKVEHLCGRKKRPNCSPHIFRFAAGSDDREQRFRCSRGPQHSREKGRAKAVNE